jgi:hydroxymethylbilane synthase
MMAGIAVISPPALCLILLRCTRGGACKGSALALAQARKVAAAIETAQRWPDGWVEIVPITTTGDKVQDRPLADIGGKALWTKELDRALLEGEVDFCVHSMKDVESIRPESIHIAAVRPRGDVRDRIIGAASIDKLKPSAIVGTSSPRRAAQVRRIRPDVRIVPIRGNVETRLRKVESGEVDATLLASAGLKRLDIEAGTAIPTEIMLPAPGQAVIGMECRTNDTRTQSVLTTVNNPITYSCVMAERAFTRALGASCHSPVAAFCAFEDGDLRMRAELFSEDGSDMVEDRAVFECDDCATPERLAHSLLAAAPDSIRRLFGA